MRDTEKYHYQKAQAEVLLFDNSDIITTSGNAGENGGCPNNWDSVPDLCAGGWGGTGNETQWG